MKKILFLVSTVMFHVFSFAQVGKQTFEYAVKDSSHLSLDVYFDTTKNITHTPCVLFVFGGAFVGGERDDSLYLKYFNGLAAHGIKVVSISYRLGLKGVTNLSVLHTKPLREAIDMAVDDVYDATNWIITNCEKLQIDPNKIILSGSSAGAITVLQAEWMHCNAFIKDRKLPETFNYAGVISFSGAVLSYHGKPAYKTKPAPALFFHGTADHIVPYKTVRLFGEGLFGSSVLANKYKKYGYPYFIFRAKNLGHEVSVIPMITQIPLVLDFIDRFVMQQQPLQIDMMVNDPSEKPMLTISANALFKKLANKNN